MAGREYHRGAHDPVRPRPSIRHRPRHPDPAGADDSGPSEKIQSDKDNPWKLASTDKNGKARQSDSPLPGRAPFRSPRSKLTYADSERKVHYEGGVVAKGSDFTASAKTRRRLSASRAVKPRILKGPAGPGQLDRMVAQDNVVIQQANRRADGQKLVYTVADDKFVLTGGPPSIFDAEQGKITGVSLTFFRRDDRVLVEGEASTPVVTQTRVAR